MWSNVNNITSEDIENIKQRSIPQVEQFFASFFENSKEEAKGHQTDLKVGIILDCYVNLFIFGNNESLESVDILNLVQLQERLIQRCEDGVQCEESMKWFLGKLQKDPICLSGTIHMKKMIDYFFQGFFQHYELYSFVLTEVQEVEVLQKEIELEIVDSFPPPLEESFDEWILERYFYSADDEEEEYEILQDSGDDDNAEKRSSGDERAEHFLANINASQLKNIIEETTNKKLLAAKDELEGKIHEKETSLLKSINKL